MQYQVMQETPTHTVTRHAKRLAVLSRITYSDTTNISPAALS